jgi:uncharacterized protein YpmB
MKLKIIIVIQTILIVLFLAIAKIRTGEAEKAHARAELLTQEAVKLTQMAELEAQRAAAKYVNIENKLKDCESNK